MYWPLVKCCSRIENIVVGRSISLLPPRSSTVYHDIWSTKTYSDGVGETGIEWDHTFDKANLFWCEGNGKRLDIGEQVFYLATSDNWEHVRRLLEHIRDSDCVHLDESVKPIPATRRP